ncbi:MAG: type I toxin-antitoxin system SymE family toxin [Lachnospiraceae bacterium]|nr:type I toxin-antitoxin system SymE family toxin [Lachnospiraceae bacterium]
MQAKELKIYKGSGRNYTPVPQIIIQGKWLRPLGFFVGDKVTVTQEGSRLIIEKSEDGHDADEEAAMVAKPVRRYNGPLGRYAGWR